MTCKNCGASLPENARFCEKCGTPVLNTAPPEYVPPVVQPAPKGNSNKMIIIIIIIIVAAIILIAGAITAIAIVSSNSGANSLTSRIELAEKYLSEQDYEQAITEFKKAIKMEPKSVNAYLGLADAYLGLDDAESAIEALEKGLDKTDNSRLQNRLDQVIKLSDIEAMDSAQDLCTELNDAAQTISNYANTSLSAAGMMGEVCDITSFTGEKANGTLKIKAAGKEGNVVFSKFSGEVNINDIEEVANTGIDAEEKATWLLANYLVEDLPDGAVFYVSASYNAVIGVIYSTSESLDKVKTYCEGGKIKPIDGLEKCYESEAGMTIGVTGKYVPE